MFFLPRGRRRLELFYDVSTDCWAMDLGGATLFKPKRTAQAVADVLGDRYKLEQVRVTKGRKIIRIAGRRGRDEAKTVRTCRDEIYSW